MSRVPQARGCAKRNLAQALAAGTREAGSAIGRTSDKGRSPSRSRSPRRAVPLHAAWKHDNVRRAAPKIQREGFRATETTTHTATTCGICSSRTRSAGWGLSTRLWQRKLLERCVWPMLRDWSGQDSGVVPLLLGTRSARKSCGEELGRSELFRSNSTAALECQAQFLCQARHQGRLDAGLGSPRRWRCTPEAQDCGVLLLERAGLSQRRMPLVRFGGEGRVGSFGTVAVPTLSSTEATLTKH